MKYGLSQEMHEPNKVDDPLEVPTAPWNLKCRNSCRYTIHLRKMNIRCPKIQYNLISNTESVLIITKQVVLQ